MTEAATERTVPEVAVVVATRNRASSLRTLLAALDAQDHPSPLEVCVCDDGSSDGTPQVLAEWARSTRHVVRLERFDEGRGPAAARNRGWRLATAPRVLFTDDDCEPVSGWVREHLAAAAAGADVVVGRTAPPEGEPFADAPLARTVRVEDARHFPTCNTSYPRAVLEAVGGFDECFRTTSFEDTELGLRVIKRGASVTFQPSALVVHPVRPPDLFAKLRESTRWAEGVQLVRKHPDARASLLHRRVFWKPSHARWLLAFAGVLAAPRRPVALILVLPWVRGAGWRRPLAELAAMFLVDGTEVATMVRGSVRHRTLVL